MKRQLTVTLCILITMLLVAVPAVALAAEGLQYEVDKTTVQLDNNGRGTLEISIPGPAANSKYSAVTFYMRFEGEMTSVSFNQTGFSTEGPMRQKSDPNTWHFAIYETEDGGEGISGDLTATVDLEYSGSSATTLTITKISRGINLGGTMSTFDNTTPRQISVVPSGAPPITGETYDITIASNITNGSVTASPTSAAEGVKVTLTADPNSGYELSSWNVRKGSSSGESISVTESADDANIATFAMPDDDVHVSASFVSSGTAGDTYDVVIASNITNGSVRASRTSAAEGVRVTLTADPNSGYELSSWNVREGSSSGNRISVGSANSASFTMPADDVYVSASFVSSGTTTTPPGGTGGTGGTGGGTGGTARPLTTVDVLDSDTPLAAVNFSDVTPDHWAYEFVEYLARRNFVTGKTETRFAPSDPITRAEFITILARMSGETLPEYAGSFTDVAADAYYAKPVAWGVQAGITTGVSATAFAPNRQITRQEIATMIMRFANYKNMTFVAVNAAITFTDDAQISDYAKAPVSTMQTANVIGGYPDGSFGPSRNATRAEAAKMLALTHYAIGN